MKKVLFKGCGTAIITPFDEVGVNYEVFARLIEFQIKEGADALIVCGTTGESSAMSDAERKATIKFAVETVRQRIPVIAGTGTNNTQYSIELSQYAESVGADGLMLVTPYYNKTTQAGLIAHFNEIAKNTGLPIIIYNVPSRTGLNLLAATWPQLAETPNIVAVKEASDNIVQITEIAKLCGDDLCIYSGNDDQTVPILSVGGSGVISVLANIIPAHIAEIVRSYLKGDVEKARKLHLSSFSLNKSLFSEVNPIPVKAALNMMGYKVGIPRLPLVEMSETGKSALAKELQAFGLIA